MNRRKPEQIVKLLRKVDEELTKLRLKPTSKGVVQS